MIKIIFLLVLGLGSGFAALAQKTPPQAVVAAFNQKFPGVSDVDWEREKNGDWEAGFEQSNLETSASFNAAGQWLETETEIAIAELPGPVKTALQGKKVKEACRIVKADGSTIFEAEVKRKDLLYDANGQLLAETKD